MWQLRSCSCGALSLTRGRVCLLYMLLALARAIFLWSESLGTCDHILLSQIWDFPFRRLLWLAGSRWRYSIPSPLTAAQLVSPLCNLRADPTEDTTSSNPSIVVMGGCLAIDWISFLPERVYRPLLRNECLFRCLLHSSDCTHPFRGLCPAAGLYTTISFSAYSLLNIIPMKIVHWHSNAPLPLPCPLLEALFRGCLCQVVCHMNDDVFHCLKSFFKGNFEFRE
jgi:hypothetical protein